MVLPRSIASLNLCHIYFHSHREACLGYWTVVRSWEFGLFFVFQILSVFVFKGVGVAQSVDATAKKSGSL